jgi:general stress protein CsbA
MKEWLKSLLTSCSKVSSKRIVAIFVTINLIVFSYVATFTNYKCPIEMFDTLALLTGGLFGGTVIERFSNQKQNGESNGSEKNSGGDL